MEYSSEKNPSKKLSEARQIFQQPQLFAQEPRYFAEIMGVIGWNFWGVWPTSTFLRVGIPWKKLFQVGGISRLTCRYLGKNPG
jgi:hypothetical protein